MLIAFLLMAGVTQAAETLKAFQPGAFIFMADRWRPANAIDGRYIWLPIQFKNGQPVIEWQDRWDLSVFQ